MESFDTLGISPSLAEALKTEEISIPTAVQAKVIPEALKNRDLIVQSQTGTGKTLAYLLPLFEKLDVSKRETQAIILAPTHELAIQVLRQVERLSQNSEIKASFAAMIGNVNIDRQIDKLKERPQIVVGSPGRILELIRKKKLSAHTVKTIIIDEADRLLDDLNLENVKAVVKSTLKERQLMVFSATITPTAEKRAGELMKEALPIREEARMEVPSSIEHVYFMAEQRKKLELLQKLLRIYKPEKALVFVTRREDAEIYAAKLEFEGFRAGSLQGLGMKADRKKVMDGFRTGNLQLLVATGIAARGLDLQGITHVFNLCIPEEPGEYLHRAGRTGRAGKKGFSVSIAAEREMPLIRMIEKALKIEMTAKALYRGEITDLKKPV